MVPLVLTHGHIHTGFCRQEWRGSPFVQHADMVLAAPSTRLCRMPAMNLGFHQRSTDPDLTSDGCHLRSTGDKRWPGCRLKFGRAILGPSKVPGKTWHRPSCLHHSQLWDVELRGATEAPPSDCSAAASSGRALGLRLSVVGVQLAGVETAQALWLKSCRFVFFTMIHTSLSSFHGHAPDRKAYQMQKHHRAGAS